MFIKEYRFWIFTALFILAGLLSLFIDAKADTNPFKKINLAGDLKASFAPTEANTYLKGSLQTQQRCQAYFGIGFRNTYQLGMSIFVTPKTNYRWGFGAAFANVSVPKKEGWNLVDAYKVNNSDRENLKGTKLYFIMGNSIQLYLGYFLSELNNSFGFVELETTLSWLYNW